MNVELKKLVNEVRAIRSMSDNGFTGKCIHDRLVKLENRIKALIKKEK